MLKSQRIRKRNYKTLGASVINSPLSYLSLILNTIALLLVGNHLIYHFQRFNILINHIQIVWASYRKDYFNLYIKLIGYTQDVGLSVQKDLAKPTTHLSSTLLGLQGRSLQFLTKEQGVTKFKIILFRGFQTYSNYKITQLLIEGRDNGLFNTLSPQSFIITFT